MLRILVLAAGLLPLTVLTVSSFIPNLSAAAPPHPEVPHLSQLELANLKATADKAEQESNFEIPLVTGIAGMDVFGAENLPKPLLADRFASVGAKLQQLTEARDSLRAYLEVYSSPPKPSPEQEVKKLTDYQAKGGLDAVVGSQGLRDTIEARVKSLNREIAARNAFEKAKTFFNSGQYAQCKTTLEAVESSALSEPEQQDAKLLKERVAFELWWLEPIGADQPVKDRRAQLDRRIAGSPVPTDPKRIEFLKERRTEAAELARRIRVDELAASPPARFRDLAEEGRRILAEDSQSMERLREAVRGWIGHRLVAKAKPAIPDAVSEAPTKQGRYLRGVFELVSDSDPQNKWYKYWSKESAYQSGEAFENQIYRTQLQAEPQKPLEVRLTNEFNGELTELLQNVGAKARWEAFAAHCEARQKDIDDYYRTQKPQSARLDFQNARELVRDVLSQWDFVARLF